MAQPNTLGERFMFSVVVTQAQATELSRLSEVRGQKRAAFVRQLIKEGIERYQRIEAVANALEAVS
jgi:predicted DNA-binding protein